jgi:RNA polymerase subunit RPABC4/transcription elongation factor Spt4
MAGTPGYPWPTYPSPSTQEGESQRIQLEAALRALREQRTQIAAEIGEFLYGLVIQGQVRDPIVLAACRRLYDHEQQVAQLEASLNALQAAQPMGQTPAFVPSVPVNQPPGALSGLPPVQPPVRQSAGGHENLETIILPSGRSSHDSGALPAVDRNLGATRIGPSVPQEGGREYGVQGGDAATVVQRVSSPSRDVRPPALQPVDLESSETEIEPVRRPDPLPGRGKATERQCAHCRMPLRANDTVCPVCGRPAADHVAQAPQCRRCGTELRPQDRSCPVCGTPRS